MEELEETILCSSHNEVYIMHSCVCSFDFWLAYLIIYSIFSQLDDHLYLCIRGDYNFNTSSHFVYEMNE